jgi:N-acetylglucosaminyl-diphospho-decaprenol L-rhamnosyltransferase
MPPVTAIIVTHNSADHIRACLAACARYGIPAIVIDNASTDGTVAAIAGTARLIANVQNRGFAAAVNQGVRAAETLYCLLLNPDVELLGSVAPLQHAIEECGHTAATGLLVNPDGTVQKGFTFRGEATPAALALEVLGINRIWPNNSVNRRYRCLNADHLVGQVVLQPAGAFLMFRKADWERLGGFDESFYPVWFEDVDFCKRLDGTIWFEPEVRAVHTGGHSVNKLDYPDRTRLWYASLLKYAVKHFSPVPRRLVAAAVAVGVIPRVLFNIRRVREQSSLTIIYSVWKLAWSCFRS